MPENTAPHEPLTLDRGSVSRSPREVTRPLRVADPRSERFMGTGQFKKEQAAPHEPDPGISKLKSKISHCRFM
jgi:hypothetical protein